LRRKGGDTPPVLCDLFVDASAIASIAKGLIATPIEVVNNDNQSFFTSGFEFSVRTI
jgi:hypothetical protein